MKQAKGGCERRERPQKQPEATRSSQKQPEAARSSQKQSEAIRSNQNQPDGSHRHLGEAVVAAGGLRFRDELAERVEQKGSVGAIGEVIAGDEEDREAAGLQRPSVRRAVVDEGVRHREVARGVRAARLRGVEGAAEDGDEDLRRDDEEIGGDQGRSGEIEDGNEDLRVMRRRSGEVSGDRMRSGEIMWRSGAHYLAT